MSRATRQQRPDPRHQQREDFRQLYAAEALHAGLVILIPNVSRVLQQRLFRAALDELATAGERVNRVLEVDLDGEDVTLTAYDLPPPAL